LQLKTNHKLIDMEGLNFEKVMEKLTRALRKNFGQAEDIKMVQNAENLIKQIRQSLEESKQEESSLHKRLMSFFNHGYDLHNDSSDPLDTDESVDRTDVLFV
jgi:uncharacterized protein (DUF1697 family)